MFLNNVKTALFIGAHPDDIELGCLGTILKLREQSSYINYLIFSLGEKKALLL